MALRPVVQGPFVKGVIASADPITQPKGSVPRASNFLFSTRGALSTCDGSALLYDFNGIVTPGARGRMEAIALYEPIGVPPYYMMLTTVGGALGPPQNLIVGSTGAGTLAADTYFYVVTALDGAGGETPVSNEVSQAVGASSSIHLCWNVVPNAWAYNVYRSTATGTEMVLSGAGLPVLQVSPLGPTVCFTDGAVATTPFPPLGFAIANLSLQVVLIGTRHVSTGYLVIDLTQPVSASYYVGKTVVVFGSSNGFLNGPPLQVTSLPNPSTVVAYNPGWVGDVPGFENGTGGTLRDPGPLTDTTIQVGLFKMPVGNSIPLQYTDANLVALFPACAPGLGVPPSGGTAGPTALPASTASGGIIGMTSRIPQFAQFTNRLAIALGNGFSPQMFWDPSGTPVNPAPTGAITGISVDAFGVVTVTTSASISITDPTSPAFLPVGSNVRLANVTNPAYDSTPGGVYVVISSASTTMGGIFQLRNLAAIGQAPSSGGTWTASTTPLINTFKSVFPSWTSGTYAVGSVVVPTTPNGFYYKAVQGGVSHATEPPTWPLVIGQQVPDGVIIWQNAGTVQSAAPPPPGCGHLVVYAGSLWAWNTWPTDNATGLSGPTAIQMSDVNNPFSWNPINQAFIDKDDGSDGMGLATFTISAEGIPPEGSLVAFKDFAGYQLIGVFGSSNFAIQRIRSDMGCSAPRTIRFVPGFGIMRFAHLGIANFDGVRDTVVSEEARPYLFPSNASITRDIIPIDAYWISMCYADLTASPPMYALAIPVGSNTFGALTRLLCYDLVLKAWAVVDLPFTISVLYQGRSSETVIPVTVFGGFEDGILQRWQSQDVQWLTGSVDPQLPRAVLSSAQIADATGRTPDQKMQYRRVAIRGISNGASSISVTPIINGVLAARATYPIPSSGDFEVFSGVFKNGWRFGAIIAASGPVEIDRVIYHLVDKSIGVPGVIS